MKINNNEKLLDNIIHILGKKIVVPSKAVLLNIKNIETFNLKQSI